MVPVVGGPVKEYQPIADEIVGSDVANAILRAMFAGAMEVDEVRGWAAELRVEGHGELAAEIEARLPLPG
jgi:hypothetical protein